jgi:hypothetical protein
MFFFESKNQPKIEYVTLVGHGGQQTWIQIPSSHSILVIFMSPAKIPRINATDAEERKF